MNTNIIKTQFIPKMEYNFKCHNSVMEMFCDVFTFKPSDIIPI